MNASPDHDVNALVYLATTHKAEWGDSCHHALAEEIVRLRGINACLLEAAKSLQDLDRIGYAVPGSIGDTYSKAMALINVAIKKSERLR